MSGKHIRKDLPALPRRMERLPLDSRGYPVPWFVAWVDGKLDFRVVEPAKLATAIGEKVCWSCGEKLGKFHAYVIGPMCAINRVSSEPPSHRDCAEFAARACPFLTRPKACRRESGLADIGAKDPAGISIDRNPGVALIWISQNGRPFRVENGILFNIGDPIEVLWFREGRPARRDEVKESIDSGYPILLRLARKDGPDAFAELERRYQSAMELLPQEFG